MTGLRALAISQQSLLHSVQFSPLRLTKALLGTGGTTASAFGYSSGNPDYILDLIGH